MTRLLLPFLLFFFSEICKYVHIHRATFYLLSQAGPPGLAFNGSGPSRLPRWLGIMNVLWPGFMRSEIFLQMKFIIFKAVWPSRLSFYLGTPPPYNQLLIQPVLLVPECYLLKMLKLGFWNFKSIFLRKQFSLIATFLS